MGPLSVARFAGRPPLTAFGGLALLALACGSSSPTGADFDGGASSGGSGGAADAATACGDYYDAVYGGGCNGPVLPAAELARQRARFVTECGSWLALPDVNLTAAAFESCAEQVQATDACRFNGAIPLCSELNATASTGSRAAGMPCSAGLQCESGMCPYAGGYAASACGACASFVPAGQPCSGNVCASTADCLGSPAVCTAIAFGVAAGSSCGQATFCGAGLYCSPTGVCTVVGAEGAPCTNNEACAAHLDCVSGTCQPPREVGAACPGGVTCDAALFCPNTTMQCTAVTWASAGQPCGGDTLCLVGDCQSNACPQVIPDGQPCTGEDLEPICDAFATCTNGVCALTASNACQ